MKRGEAARLYLIETAARFVYARHSPVEETDYVAIPPITELVCHECPVGDWYQRWPCWTARVLRQPLGEPE